MYSILLLSSVLVYLSNGAEWGCKATKNILGQPIPIDVCTGSTLFGESSTIYICNGTTSVIQRSYDTADCTGEYTEEEVKNIIDEPDEFDCNSTAGHIALYFYPSINI